MPHGNILELVFSSMSMLCSVKGSEKEKNIGGMFAIYFYSIILISVLYFWMSHGCFIELTKLELNVLVSQIRLFLFFSVAIKIFG